MFEDASYTLSNYGQNIYQILNCKQSNQEEVVAISKLIWLKFSSACSSVLSSLQVSSPSLSLPLEAFEHKNLLNYRFFFYFMNENEVIESLNCYRKKN